ncbi:DinB family protein [Kaistella palustris]|uniref:DinB family protein n=1 Tax=Kaistella palustris TaxID=493376 RepID=UPI000412008A|nr:DinB family protein [Kaistella palustris]
MEIIPLLKKEFRDEYETTKKFLVSFPTDKNDYSPHPKSMKLMPLATHIVEIFGWPEFIMKNENQNFEPGEYQPLLLTSGSELLQKLEESYRKSSQTLDNMQEDELEGRWSMSVSGKVILDLSKYEAIRHALSQIIHHRAQLGVYYRLNDIPLPGSYGPSADQQNDY